jgi:hypothetical protein
METVSTDEVTLVAFLEHNVRRGCHMASSHREHNVEDGRIVTASVYQLGDTYRASVIDGNPSKVPTDVTCVDEVAARQRADEMLVGAYPHDCFAARCNGWTPHAN